VPPDSLKFRLSAWLAGALGPLVVRGMFCTCKVFLSGSAPDLLARARAGTPLIGVLWHEDLALHAYVFRGTNFTVLVSRSTDGEIGSRVARRLGIRTVRGSSSRGGEYALEEIIETLRGGGSVGFIGDGPRGPRHVLKMGPVMAAKLSGRPIVPVACAMSSEARLRSWDRTRFPVPFARIIAIAGEPVSVPSEASRQECEHIRQHIQDEMRRLEIVAETTLAGADEPAGLARG
jgi:lysophospholipid acyltransferase (LPLAT)-like uncharacterized protein